MSFHVHCFVATPLCNCFYLSPDAGLGHWHNKRSASSAAVHNRQFAGEKVQRQIAFHS